MTSKKDEDTKTYKPRKLNEQGGSTITSLPKDLLKEAAEAHKVTLKELVTDFNLVIELHRGERGLIDGWMEFYFEPRDAKVEVGGGV